MILSNLGMNNIMIIMRTFALSGLLVLLSVFSVFAEPAVIKIEDAGLKLQEYHWACKINKLAMVLTLDNTQTSFIYILDPATKKFTHKIQLPYLLKPKEVAWLSDDSGFFILIDNDPMWMNEIFKYSISDHSFRKSSLNGTSVYKITFDRSSDFWAANIAEEGHMGVLIYKGDKFIESLGRRPESYIFAFAWYNGKLLCKSDVMLDDELGYGPKAYSVNYNEDMIRKDDAEIFLFEIDPVKKKAMKVKSGSINIKDVLNTSSDGKYYVKIEAPEKGGVVINLY